MRPFVLILLIGLAIGLAVRAHYTGRTPVISLVLIGIITIPLAVMEGRWISNQRTLSTAVQQIADRPEANVHCQRATEAMFYAEAELGMVQFEEDGGTSPTAFLTMSTCQHIRDWLASDKSNPTMEQVLAVHILTHEAMHVAGYQNEAETECYAMQKDAELAVSLGATPEQGQALAQTYYKEVYPQMRENYRSEQCTQGGALDLTPLDGSFP